MKKGKRGRLFSAKLKGMKKAPSPRRQDHRVALGAALILIAVLLFFLGDPQTSGKVDMSSTETQQKVNRHLQQTSRDIFLRERKAYLENQKTLQDIKHTRPQPKFDGDKHEFSLSRYEERPQFNEEVGRGKKEFSFPSDPQQLIQTELFHDQREHEYTEAYKKEYARRFVEEAKQKGYLIQMDSSYRVISVRPLRKRQPTQELFNGESAGGR